MRRFCFAVVMLIVASGFLALPIAAAQETITLEVALTAGRDPNVNLVQDYGIESWADVLAREFNKLYPHVQVEFRVANLEQVAVMIASGIGPDIVNGAANRFVEMGRAGAFVDLAPLLAAEGIDLEASQTYWPPQMAAFEYQGRLFALPQYLGTVAMQYNADMFAYAGIPDPDPRADVNTMDWEEFENIAKKLTQDTNGDGITDVYGFGKVMGGNRVHHWQISAGAQPYGNEERTVSLLDSPAGIEALEYLQSLRWEAGVIAPPGVSASWERGEVAIHERGSWEMVRYLGLDSRGEPKVSFGWNVFPMPIGPSGERATFATIDGYAINRNTKYPEEAYALLKFLAGPVANEILAKYLGLQPAHRDVVPEYISLMRLLNRDVSEIHMHVFTDAGPYAYPQLLYSEVELANRVIYEAYTKILDENQPAGPVFTEAIQRLNRILAADGREIEIEDVAWQGEQWMSRDFNTALVGYAKVEDDTLRLAADGADIWDAKDGFRYMYREIEGDFTATLRLEMAPDTNNWSKAGVMLRVEEDEASANVAVLGTHRNGVVMQERLVSGASSRTAGRTSWTNGTPAYLRLVREGNRVTGYMSSDGLTWRHLSDVTIELPDTVLIGVAVTSHSPGVLGEAVFTDWELTPLP